MKKLYLLGHPVSHSLSPKMQNAAIKHLGLDWEYATLDVLPEDLVATLERLEADPDVVGCNVTVPHKVGVYEWLQSRDRELLPSAECAGAANTLFRTADGTFGGDSTDFRGAMVALEQEAPISDLSIRDVAILGTGGSAQSIVAGFDFQRRVGSISIFGRNLTKARQIRSGNNYETALHPLADFKGWNEGRKSIVIQTTTVGMESGKDSGRSPIPPGSVQSGQIAFDLVYKPHETPFLVDARANGAKVVHGIGMLVGQGALSLELWHGSSCRLKNRSSFDRRVVVDVMLKSLTA